MSDRPERLHPADEAWLEHALAEVARGETPPDLSAAILRASPARRAAASAVVDAAARGPSPTRQPPWGRPARQALWKSSTSFGGSVGAVNTR